MVVENSSWATDLYQRRSGLVLGFHGCDQAVGEAVLRGKQTHLAPSTNDYDWLGGGVYFWENDPQRAMEFATEASKKPHLSKGHIEKPFVIGAVIDLGLCLDLLDRAGLDELKQAYDFFKATYTPNKKHPNFPKNQGKDRGARFLDAAVIDTLHTLRSEVNESPYDSVRGAFWEGGELYPGAGFDKKSHIQIAVRNPQACIKGYFRPLAK